MSCHGSDEGLPFSRKGRMRISPDSISCSGGWVAVGGIVSRQLPPFHEARMQAERQEGEEQEQTTACR